MKVCSSALALPGKRVVCSERDFFEGYRIRVQRQSSVDAVRGGTKRVGEDTLLSIAIASFVALVIVGALAGLFFFRAFGQAAARNENQPVGESEEDANPQGSLGEETRRSVWYFLGVGAAGSAILVDIAAIATAFSGSQEFLNNAVPVAFIAFTLAVIAYFLGARMLAVGAVVFTVIAIAAAAVILQWL